MSEPILESMRAIEDDFAEAMSRMYSVGNDLARVRARLSAEATDVASTAAAAAAAEAVEADPEHWTPVAEPVASAPRPSPAQPSPPPIAPGHVMPPPAPVTTPPFVPPTAALPPAEPWWQRDGLVAKVLAVVGTAITLIGVAFLLALAIQMGFFGPLARVLSGGLLAIALIGAAVVVRRRPSGTIGALGLAATGIATAYLDVLAVTRIYEWVPLAVGMIIAGLIALGGVLLARSWDSQLLAVVAVLGVALMAPFVGLEHGLLTGAFLLVLAAASWPAQIGRDWWVLELARILPTALFLTALAAVHERSGIAGLLGVLFAVLVLGTSLAGARIPRLPQQLGALVPVGVLPLGAAALAVDDRWSGAGLFVVATCLLVFVAGLADHPVGTPAQHRLPEFALASAGLTSLCAALRVSDGQDWTPVIGVALCLVWAVTALVLRHRVTLVVALALGALATIGAMSLLPHIVLRSLSDEVAVRHLLAATGVAVLYLVLARAVTSVLPALAPVLPRALLALSALWVGGSVVLLITLVGQLVDDPRGGFTAGQAGATVVWMAIAALLLLRGLRGSTFAIPAGLALAAVSVGKLLLFDLSFLGGLARVLSFIVAGLLLLGMGAGFAQALERTRRTSQPHPGAGPVENPAPAGPLPPSV
ncbi:hypothetical protein ASG73_15370 [Janibacter sp. Soil728]|nr:hypothetical protein ASG73_15370 [Janibacter sp. Soil728]